MFHKESLTFSYLFLFFLQRKNLLHFLSFSSSFKKKMEDVLPLFLSSLNTDKNATHKSLTFSHLFLLFHQQRNFWIFSLSFSTSFKRKWRCIAVISIFSKHRQKCHKWTMCRCCREWKVTITLMADEAWHDSLPTSVTISTYLC